MKFIRVLSLVLVAVMMLGIFASCGNGEDKDNTQVELKLPEFEDDEAIYDSVLKAYYEAYAAAKEAKTVSERFALMAIAEAKMLEAGIMVPMQSNGGNYAISKVAPYTITPVLWGNDSDRYHDALVCTTPITPSDRDALKALWAEKKGTGTYLAEARAYLTSKGYTIQRTYTLGYISDPETYDAFLTSNAADSEVLVNTFDGLVEYDVENVIKPALATSWTVSEDGLKYTFKIREGAKWVDSTGAVIGTVKADDFVAGFNHMLDDPEGGLSWLVDGVIAGVSEYCAGETTDFATVGVKAIDDSTLEYTLTEPCSYFLTMFGYNVFAPLNRQYYESKGGKFGMGAETGTYGTDKDNIAYCGPYLISSAIKENTFVFDKNPNYWNADNINIDKITWLYNDGKIATQAYSDFKDGKLDGCGLNTAALELAKKDGNFEKYAYVSGTDATSFPGFLNVYRRGFVNFNKETALISTQDETTKIRTAWAMLNENFRLAICFGLDRGQYMEQTVGPDLKYTSMVNSYVPGTFVTLEEDVTVKINGTDTTFKKGTFYGEVMQAQIDADKFPAKVFDKTMDGGIGSSSGFDGWYNVEASKSYLAKAVEELKAKGVEVTKENPIHIEYPFQDDGSVSTARANVVKNSLEAASDGLIKVDLNPTTDRVEYHYASYYFNTGAQANYNLSLNSGWGPDYGDPSTFLDTMIKGGGYMLKCIGLDA